MRRSIFIVLLFPFGVFCNPLNMPVVSEGQYKTGWPSPVVGYRTDVNGDSHLYIGNGAPMGSSVVDDTAIRGNPTRLADAGEYAISIGKPAYSFGSEIRLDGQTNATINIQTFGNTEIKNLKIDFYQVRSAFFGLGGMATAKVTGKNTAQIYMNNIANALISVTNIALYVRSPHGRGVTNDLTNFEVILRDTLGLYNFNYLRFWTKHLYDGNRGEDWGEYVPKSNPTLGGHYLAFSSNRVIRLSSESISSKTNSVTMYVDALPVYTVAQHEAVKTGTCKITACSVTNSLFYLSLYCSNTFDPNKDVKIYVTHNLIQPDWKITTSFTFSGWATVQSLKSANYIVRCDNFGLGGHFFKCAVGALESNAVEMRFHIAPNFEKGFQIDGKNIIVADNGMLCETNKYDSIMNGIKSIAENVTTNSTQTLFQKMIMCGGFAYGRNVPLANNASIYKLQKEYTYDSRTNVYFETYLKIPNNAIMTFEVYCVSNDWAWPSSVTWLGDHDITATNALFAFRSFDAGTNWIGNKQGEW